MPCLPRAPLAALVLVIAGLVAVAAIAIAAPPAPHARLAPGVDVVVDRLAPRRLELQVQRYEQELPALPASRADRSRRAVARRS